MKKLIITVLCVALSLGASGCTAYSNYGSPKDPVSFYYCTQSSDHSESRTIIDVEPREALGHKDDPTYLLNLYLAGPISYQFASPFPAGVSLQELTINNGVAEITLSNQITQLSDYNITLALACLVLTADSILNVESVTIRAADALIYDSPSVTLSPEDFAFLTETTKLFP